MEAIFLACGAGGPQLKRNPLGGHPLPLTAMRLLPTSLALVLAAMPAPAQQGPQLPSIVRSGLLAYQQRGAAAALKAWTLDSPVAQKGGAEAEHAFGQIESAYGHMIGYDVLAIVPLGSHVLRSYLIILYESGPVYIWFDCYKKVDHWVLTGFLFNVKPDVILPPMMLTP